MQVSEVLAYAAALLEDLLQGSGNCSGLRVELEITMDAMHQVNRSFKHRPAGHKTLGGVHGKPRPEGNQWRWQNKFTRPIPVQPKVLSAEVPNLFPTHVTLSWQQGPGIHLDFTMRGDGQFTMRAFNRDEVHVIPEIILVSICDSGLRVAAQAEIEAVLKLELARLQTDEVVRNGDRVVILVNCAV